MISAFVAGRPPTFNVARCLSSTLYRDERYAVLARRRHANWRCLRPVVSPLVNAQAKRPGDHFTASISANNEAGGAEASSLFLAAGQCISHALIDRRHALLVYSLARVSGRPGFSFNAQPETATGEPRQALKREPSPPDRFHIG